MSSFLRVFSTLYELTDNSSWLQEYREARAGYPNLCKQAPHGIGHALASIAEMEVGICSISCNTEQVDEILLKISQKPYRAIFVSIFDEKENNEIRLRIGDKFEEKMNNVTKSIDLIFS